MCPALEVVWGDMSDYDTIKKCVDGCDYVLHIGAMVSPAADKYPEETLYTNIGSTLNIIKAIKEQPDPDKVHLAYVGTVAMTGSRLEPVHFGRVGDPNPSIHDYYALSKVFTEAALYDCGLKYWVSIRRLVSIQVQRRQLRNQSCSISHRTMYWSGAHRLSPVSVWQTYVKTG